MTLPRAVKRWGTRGRAIGPGGTALAAALALLAWPSQPLAQVGALPLAVGAVAGAAAPAPAPDPAVPATPGTPGGLVGAPALAAPASGSRGADSDTPATAADPANHAVSVPELPSATVATQDDEDAIFAMAVEATRRRDFPRAFDLFERLAEADVADAQFNLGVLLRQGRGRPQNYRAALYWAWLSHLGEEPRARALAQDLAEVLPPEVRAEVAARLASRLEAQLAQGNRRAILKYARLQAELKPEPDPVTAHVWFSIATALGIVGGIDHLNALAKGMELEAILAAQSRAQEVFAASAFASARQGDGPAIDPAAPR